MNAAITTIATLYYTNERFHPTERLIFHSDLSIQYAVKISKNSMQTMK
ncbi:hypothetical protein J7K93_02695 [bacterium]|nr:hypothetical protein [bacterium]